MAGLRTDEAPSLTLPPSPRETVSEASTSWVPPLVVALVACCWALLGTGVGVSDLVVFVAVQVVAYAVPGTLVWRALRGADSWLSDLTFGTVLAHAVTVGVYILGRSLGAPLLVWLPPVVVLVLFSVRPGLRRHWRGDPSRRVPGWFGWVVSAAVVLPAAWFGRVASQNSIGGRDVVWQSTDHPYLLSVAAEAKHHVPPVTPFLVDVPLDYHWFSFADVAALSWQGGQELDVLLFRLFPFGCLVLSFVAFALLARHVSRSHVVAAVCVALAVLVGSINFLAGRQSVIVDSTLLLINWTASPSQAFGQLLAMPVVLLVVEILRTRSGRAGASRWGTVLVLTLALMGAKATFIPVIGAGLLLVVVRQLVRRRGVAGPALGLGVLLALELVFAQYVLFGGASQGLSPDPAQALSQLGLVTDAQSGGAVLVVAVALLAGWLGPVLAGVAVLRRPAAPQPGDLDDSPRVGTTTDPAVWLLLGVVGSSVAIPLVLAHPGASQYFFLRSGLPFAYLLAGWGLVLLVRQVRRRWWFLLGGPALGVITLLATRSWTGDPAQQQTSPGELMLVLAVAAAVTVLVAGAGGVLAGGDRAGRRAGALLAASLCLLGMGGVRTVDLAHRFVEGRPARPDVGVGYQPVPDGGLAAARYVRDHSDPDQMIATNAHFRYPLGEGVDPRAFWMAAWSERRAVLEGWGYTARANSRPLGAPFWDPELQELNDDVFLAPSRAHLAALTDRYDVGWLVVDLRFPAEVRKLERLLPGSRIFGDTMVFPVSR